MKKAIYLLVFIVLGVSVSAQELELKVNKEFTGLGEYVMQAQFSPFRWRVPARIVLKSETAVDNPGM